MVYYQAPIVLVCIAQDVLVRQEHERRRLLALRAQQAQEVVPNDLQLVRDLNGPEVTQWVIMVLERDPTLVEHWPQTLPIGSGVLAYQILKALGFKKTHTALETVDQWKAKFACRTDLDLSRVSDDHLNHLRQLAHPLLFP